MIYFRIKNYSSEYFFLCVNVLIITALYFWKAGRASKMLKYFITLDLLSLRLVREDSQVQEFRKIEYSSDPVATWLATNGAGVRL
jgi:hypothetical protein